MSDARKALRVRLLGVALWLGLGLPWALLWGDDWLLAQAQLSTTWRATGWPFMLVHNSVWAFYALYAGLLIWAALRRQRWFLSIVVIYVLAQLLISVLLVRLLKISIGRPRPEFFGQGWQSFSGQAAFESFPSGHSADAGVGAGVADAQLGSWLVRGLSFVLLLLTMLGRVLEEKHYPSDVIVGAALGYLGGLLLGLWIDRWARRQALQNP